MEKFLLAAATGIGLAVPSAASAAFLVNFANNFAVSPANDFRTQLSALGQTRFTTAGMITLTSAANITFEYLGSESGSVDRFMAGSVVGTEDNTSNFGNPVLLGSGSYTAATFAPVFSSVASGLTSVPGQDSFGVYLGSETSMTGSFTSDVLYFAFDDQVTGSDDDYDDFIIRATVSSAVPEPATWAMMFFGLGAAGVALRSRSRKTIVSLA